MAKAKAKQGDIPAEERVFYYESFEDDPIQTKEQEATGNKVELEDGYVFIKKNPFVKLFSAVLYRGFKVYAHHYAKSYLHLTVKNRDLLKKAKGTGYVIYANHTNPYHDAFSPAIVADRHIYTICSPANLHVPKVGKFLPYLGALPLGKDKEQKAKFNDAVDKRLKQKNCLVIYPEAHVWPYYTGIRPFPAGDRSFKYPVRNNLPIFTMTTTYQKAKDGGERPDTVVYIDGPFYPDPKLSEDENRAKLAKEAYDSMVKQAKHSNCDYFKYIKKSEKAKKEK